MTPGALKSALVNAAAARYHAAGKFAVHFARGKLRVDPLFVALLEGGLIPSVARVLDLGCGQGLLSAWLLAAQASARRGQWCGQWPTPPHTISLHGIEVMARDVTRARLALGSEAEVALGDICRTAFVAADAIVILDVLHYLSYASQEEVLRRARASLAAGGVLLLRVGNADGGWAFKISNWIDQSVLLARGHGWVPLRCRSIPQWLQLLDRLEFQVETKPMSKGTPFANVLLIGRVP